MSNSPFLNFWNHSRQFLLLKTASLYVSTSNRCASAADFFKLKKQIKSSRKWRLFGSKLEIFAHKRIHYTNKNLLIFQGYVVDRCSTLRQWSFISVNFNQNLLVASTFVKRRKLICTPEISFLPFRHQWECISFIWKMTRNFHQILTFWDRLSQKKMILQNCLSVCNRS